MKTVYIIGVVVGAVAVGAAAYGGYRMLRATKDAEQRPGVSDLSLLSGGYVFSTPVVASVNRAGQPVYTPRMTRGEEQHEPGSVQWTDVDTTENAGRPRQGKIIRTNVLMLR